MCSDAQFTAERQPGDGQDGVNNRVAFFISQNGQEGEIKYSDTRVDACAGVWGKNDQPNE